MTERSDKTISIPFCVSLANSKFEVQNLAFGGVMPEPEEIWDDIRIENKRL